MRYWSICASAAVARRRPAGSGALVRFLAAWLALGGLAAGQISAPTPLSETTPHKQQTPRVAALPKGGPPTCWCFGESEAPSGTPVADGTGDLSARPPDMFYGPQQTTYGPSDALAQPVEVPYGPADAYGPEDQIREPVTYLHLRHSSTHGRHVGRGWPLVGTSWLNRPYFAGGSLGPMWMTRRVEDSVGRDIDLFGDVFAGWDWDHYWGSELEIGWSTPELINSNTPYVQRSDRMSFWSYNHLYYFWGDSLLRPYVRAGIGTTEISFPRDNGTVRHEILLTLPLGLGVKYPLRRWLATRMELTDYLALGEGGVPTQHNLALTFSLEWRFGVHPASYWPWNPSRHMW